MRIFVAGATGQSASVWCRCSSRGHHVVASTPGCEQHRATACRGRGTCGPGWIGKDAVLMTTSHPEAIVHQMTALASMRNVKNFDRDFL